MALYRGKGGAEFDMTPPREGSMQREYFDAQVESGEIVLVESKPAAKAAPKPKVSDGE